MAAASRGGKGGRKKLAGYSLVTEIAKGELDIAVCSGPATLSEHLHSTEPTVWAASWQADFQFSETLPLAQLDRRCWWREMTETALANAKIPFRNVFLSNDYTSLKAAIRSGLAVGALPLSGLDASLRTLTEEDGMPSLPPAVRSILTSKRANPELASAMRTSLLTSAADA